VTAEIVGDHDRSKLQWTEYTCALIPTDDSVTNQRSYDRMAITNNCAHDTDPYSGINVWPWHRGWWSLIFGRSWQRKHIYPVKLAVEFFADRPLLGVQFVTSLEANLMCSCNLIQH